MEHEHLKKVLAGDTHAFRYFVEQYQDMAYAIAIGIVKNRPEAEEIVQDGFMKAFQHLASFKREAKFSTWLYRIVVNEALQRAQRRKLPLADIPDEQLPDRVDSNAVNHALEQLEREEREKIIQQVLQRLPAKEALVLQLFYLHEMSIREVQEMTGFSNSHIKTLLHRARKRFYQKAQAIYQQEPWL